MSPKQPKLGQRVEVTGKNLQGRVAYVGRTNFAAGLWFGVILDEPLGKNNGTLQGSTYFKCPRNCGLFVRGQQLLKIEERPKEPDNQKTDEMQRNEGAVKAKLLRRSGGKSVDEQDNQREQLAATTSGKVKAATTPSNSSSASPQHRPKVAPGQTQKEQTLAKTSGKFLAAQPQPLQLPKNPMEAEENPKPAATLQQSKMQPEKSTELEPAVTQQPKPEEKEKPTKSTQEAQPASNPLQTSTLGQLPFLKGDSAAAQLTPPAMTCNQRRSTSYTQLRPTRISQPKPTTAQAQSSTAQLTLNMPVPLALAPKRSKTSICPTSSVKRGAPAAFVEPGFLEILRPQFTPGPALRTPSTMAPPPSQPVDNPELRQLREELQLLRGQKSEDKLRLLELERTRIQNEQLLEFKAQIMTQHVLLQRELQRSRHELREAQDTVSKYKRELDEVAESIELLTLDKEMAEERMETLQMELEMAQERNDELTLDVEILKAEQEEHQGQRIEKTEKQTAVGATPQSAGEFLRLEQYNQRLRETVVRLRDTLAQEKQQAQRSHKELETKHSEINELKSIKELLSRRVDHMEVQLMDLKEQVDASLGAESMVTQLASLKLELEDRVKLLEDEVNELEALEQIQEQLIESNQELETDLREEIDKLGGQVKILDQQKHAAMESLYDRDVTIMKFRDLVRQLQEQLQLRADGTLSIDDFSSANESQQEEASNQSQNDYQHIFSVSKAYGRALEQQIKAVELRLQGQHLEHVLAFVPEQFLLRGGEHDVVLVMLLLERMNEKLTIVCQAINEKFPTACEFGRDAIFEGYSVQRFIFRSQCIYLLKSLQVVLQQFRHGLNHCDYELCTHAAIYRSDLEIQEQQLDEFVRLLKTGHLDEHTNCEPIQRVLHYVNALHQNLMPPQALVELLDEQQLYAALIEVYEAGLDAVNANAGLMHTIIQLGHEQTASFHCMQLLMEQSCSQKQKLKKLQRKLSGSKTAAWTGMQCARYQRILEANEALGALITILGATAREASKESNGGIAHEKLWRMLVLNYNKFAPTQEADELKEVDAYSQRCMQLLEEQLDELCALLESTDVNTEYVRHPTTNTLQERAAQVKRHYEDVKSFEQTVGERDKEIKSLKYTAKMKQQDYSELQIRKEMAEKQLSKQCHMLTSIAEAAEQLEQCMLSKEAALNQTINMLAEKIASLEQAQQHWQEQQQADSACVTSSTLSSNRELNMLHHALRQERLLRVQLQGSEMRKTFASLEPLHVPQASSSSSQLMILDKDLRSLKNQWLLAHLELGPAGSQRRSEIELQGSRVLRHIFQTYCTQHPYRAKDTDFGLFISEDMRRAFGPSF
ncbi:dynactin subunit 1 [Drosophila subobscura]|uniref:dynactin subunit 1 n=1 Tax=Drosophila subobscura TaxID=7241 RepID=UPI00155A4295|nr:dynactin subunit 1 [Drosophila subobscura]